jgi:site-specific DNA-methyltransferase (adenine-specific)
MRRKKKEVSGEVFTPKKYGSVTTELGRTIDLYLGDCFIGLKDVISPLSVDVLVTSPPYNIGIDYSRYDDTIPRDAYLKWIREWAGLVKQALKPDGSLFLNFGSKPSDPWVPFDVASQFRDIFILQNTIHWVKSISIMSKSYGRDTSMNVGHFKPINSKRFLNDTHEYIFHFTKTGNVEIDRLSIGVPYTDETNAKRWKSGSKGSRCRGNSWFIPYSTIQSRIKDRPHPASFPPELAEMCIRLHGLERANLVVDPFLGIGNAAIACARLGVDMVGFEIDEDYLAVTKQTLESKNNGKP